MINCACVSDEPPMIKVLGWYTNIFSNKQSQNETPRRFETPGSPRSYAHAHNLSGEDMKNGDRRICKHDADMNVDVIYTFNSRKEGLNGVSSIKMDIYFTLGCVWLAASSILRYVADGSAAWTDPIDISKQTIG